MRDSPQRRRRNPEEARKLAHEGHNGNTKESLLFALRMHKVLIFDIPLKLRDTPSMRFTATYAYYYYATLDTGRVRRRMR
jgi:hypothetical protein